MTARRNRWTVWLEGFLVLIYFGMLTVLMTWPLVLRMKDSFVGQAGDNYYFLWEIGWVQKALFDLHIPPHFVPTINYPEGWHLAYADMAPLTIGTALPASVLLGPVFGYNFAILVSYLLTGVNMYLWVRRLTERPAAGLIAGTLFAFSPYRFAHYLAGHLELMGTEWLPLYFMGLFQTLQGQRRSTPNLLVTAGTLGLIAVTSIHYLYLTLVVTAAAFLGALFLQRRDRSSLTRIVVGLTMIILVALPVIGLVVAPYVDLARKADLPVRSMEYARQFSASPTDFILPATFHPIWGQWVGDHFDRSYWMEASLYVGAVGAILAVTALILPRRVAHERRLVALLCWSALAAFVLALGINLQWLARPVLVETPDFLRQWHPNPQARIPLPGYLLFKLLPFYSSMRVWMRFGVFFLLFASALAGIGAGALLARLEGSRKRFLLLGIIGLILLDFWPKRQPFTRVETQPLDLWLAAQPGEGAVAPFPFQAADSQEMLYRTLVHGRPFVGAHYATYATPQYLRIGPVMDGFPSEESVSLLQELDVQYVWVSSAAYPDFAAVDHRIQSLGLERRAQFGDTVVYELR